MLHRRQLRRRHARPGQRQKARKARGGVLYPECDAHGPGIRKVRRVVSSLRPRRAEGENGSFIVLWALLIVGLMTMVAIVVDLGDARATRRNDQSSADFAALAAGDNLLTKSPQACADAWSYIQQ